MPKSLTDPQQTLLPLFASANARAAPNLPPNAASKRLNDVVFNVGGPVWALDWCPAHADEDGEETAAQYLAVRHPSVQHRLCGRVGSTGWLTHRRGPGRLCKHVRGGR